MPTHIVIGANTMNCDSTTNSASASGPEFEPRSLVIRVADVALPNGRNSVRGLSLATLAAALAACGGGGSGGPAAPPPPPPPPPPNNAPTATDAAGTATEDGDPATGKAVGADEDGDPLTYKVTQNGKYGSLDLADNGDWTYNPDNDNDTVNALAEGAELTDTATIEVSDGEATATATVTITIQGANDAPTGRDSADEVTAGTGDKGKGTVSPADVDDGDTHTFAVGTQTEHGRLSVDEAGNWTYILDEDDKDVMALDEGDTAMDTGTIVITDNNGGTATVAVNVTIKGVNDAPMPSMHAMDDMGMPVLLEVVRDAKTGKRKEGDDGTMMHSAFEVVAGTQGVDIELDMAMMFMDPEGRNLEYRLDGAPKWLTLESKNEAGETRWMLKGTPSFAGKEDFKTSVKLVAADEVGGEGMIAFDIIWDDGNDEPYNLIVRDADGDEEYTSDPVSENMKGIGTGLFVEVKDDDNPDHKFGMITWKVGDGKMFEVAKTGEIVLKAGVSLDYEKLKGVNYKLNVDVIATDGGGKSHQPVNVTIDVKNENDPVMKGVMPGNWWVTVDDGIDKDDVTEGQWLSFFIEEPDDSKPLFKDEDGEADLEYSLKSSPAWLMIDKKTGQIQNVKEMLPTRGVHDVTVVATDKGGKMAEQTFKLAVAFSDDNNKDNDAPKIVSERGEDVAENSSEGVRLATFTVEDDDLDLAGLHPYSPEMPTITVASASLANATPTTWNAEQIKARLKIKKLSGDNDSQTYEIVGMKTDGKGGWLDYETLDELEITISVTDGVADAVTDTIKVDIDDVNEKPYFDAVANKSTDNGVIAAREQQEASKDTVWLNLTQLFEDAEDGATQRDELTFSNLTGLPSWIKPLYNTGNLTTTWEDVTDAGSDTSVTTDPDGDDDWGATNAPDEDDFVLILEIDRTPESKMDGQDTVGKDMFSVTVTDSEGMSYMHEFALTVTDENTAPAGAAGAGVMFPTDIREGNRINVSFKEAVDPDFDGADNMPVEVLYQIESGNDKLQVSKNASQSYEVMQSDVGNTLTGRVIYFELDENAVASIVRSDSQNPPAQLEKDSTTVTNAEDRGTATFTFNTGDVNDTNEINVVATVTDEDVGEADSKYVVQSSALTYQWQWSENGGGNWQDFGTNSPTVALLEAQSGKFIRVEVTYDGAHGATERNETIRSDAFKVGKVNTTDTTKTEVKTEDLAAPTASALVGTDAAIGAVLSLPETVGTNADIQWMANDMPIPGATGRTFTITQAQAGAQIKVMVEEKNADGGLTSVNTSAPIDVDGSPPGNSAPTGKPKVYDLGDAPPAKAGTLVSMHENRIDLSEIFSDFNDDKLTYSLGSVSGVGNLESDVGSDLVVYRSAASQTDGNTLLIIDPDTAEVWIHTTQTRGHDGNREDGQGNIINLPYTATDPSAGSSGAVNVGLRIDVKATGITSSTNNDDITGFKLETNINEGTDDTWSGININIFDENKSDHKFGKYDWANATVMHGKEESTLFEVKAVKADASQATLKLKEKAEVPYVLEETDHKLVIKVKPMGVIDDEVMITVTLKIQNSDTTSDKNPTAPTPPTPTDVPGLKDDETTSPDNETEDDATDTDDDGGTNPPPMDSMAAMMSMLDDGIF